jgi:hypothetical protein
MKRAINSNHLPGYTALAADRMNDPINVPPAVLLRRMARLESLVSGLQKELAAQKAVLEDLGKAFEMHSSSAHKHLLRLDDRLLETDLNLLEVMEKLFPGYARTQVQIKKVLKNKHRPDGKNHI